MSNEAEVQAVFNKVLAAGNYAEALAKGWGMCSTLGRAYDWDVIAREEHDLAKQAVDKYLEDTNHAHLRSALRSSGYPAEPVDLVQLYHNWAERPELLKGDAYVRD